MISILGIDPGKSGGLAFIADENIKVWPMPIAGSTPDSLEIVNILKEFKPGIVAIEQVHAMPGQGVTSMFTFGRGFGKIEGIVEALGFSIMLITPQAWKKLILAGTAKDKNAAVEFCRRRWPSLSLIPEGYRKPHEGICDALCIAEYAREKKAGE